MFIALQAALDPIGNITLALQIVILFLLVLGLPFVRGPSGKKNLMWHGYSTMLALILHTVLIIWVMIPGLTEGFADLSELSLFYVANVWSHVILGTAAEVLGIIVVALWLVRGPSKMMCGRYKKWMTPIFVIWVISIVNGALVHIFGMV